ncbi:hypothetical protein L7F22_061578 [Adiantum nelumboides]|nr:hypothetical protein [Adiantum nelumboides]
MATCKVACDSSDDLGHFYSTCAPQALSSQSTSPQAPASVSSNVQSVNKTLSQLRQLASQGSFYGNVTASSSYEHLNGAYLCRQDLTQQECAQCVNEAIQVSQKDCMNVDEASIILNGCIIRYQQIPFFNLDTSSLVWGCNNGTRETSINSKQNMVKLVRTIIDKAPASEQFFSAGIIGDGKNSKVYGMAQCWPYVDLDQCRFCLSDLGDSALSSSSQQQCCNNSDTLFGSRLYHPSCFLRIENFPFFKTKDSMIISVSSIEHKETWEHYLPLVEYAYNNTVHASTGKAPFEIVEGGKKVPPILQTKDKIFEADKLKLPEGWKIHNAFHVSLLRPVGDVPEDMVPEEQPKVEELDEILVSEQILAQKDRKVRGKVARHYLVKFKNYSLVDAKWMEKAELVDSPKLLQLYLEAF